MKLVSFKVHSRKLLGIPHLGVIVLLALLIPLFYWVFSRGLVLPGADGSQMFALYSHLYSGFVSHGQYFLWDSFAIGGSEVILADYVLYGISPLDPILRVWFPISKFLALNILSSYYFYLLFYILVGALGTYFLGLRHFFKNRETSFFLALLFATSGYLVSNTGMMNFMIPYVWLPLILLFGMECVHKNRGGDYFLLALSISTMLANYPTITLGVLLFAVGFLLVQYLFKLREGDDLKNRFLKLCLFAVLLILFSSGFLYVYLKYTMEGARYLDNLDMFFFGLPMAMKDSSLVMDFQWIFNTFIPNSNLAQWGGYGNGGLFFNGFYYLGALFPILLLMGMYSLSRESRLRPVAIGLLVSSIIAVFLASGHPILRLFPEINLLLKYPHFMRPLLIFSLILFTSFGFDYLFRKFRDQKNSDSLRKMFLICIPILITLSFIILLIFNYVDKDFGDKFQILYTLSYLILFGLFYALAVLLDAHKFFVVVLYFDLLFFLSASYPLIVSPHPKTEKSTITAHLNAQSVLEMPKTLDYSMSKTYPGMHFAFGPIMFRESAFPEIGRGSMPNRRAHWVETAIQKDFVDTNSRYDALSLLGVSKKRYFFADGGFLVDSFEDIAPTLSKVYSEYRKKNGGNPLQYEEPVVFSEAEPRVINDQELIMPNEKGIPLSRELEGYVSSLSTAVVWQEQLLKAEDFSLLSGQFLGDEVYRYGGRIPAVRGLTTESNVYENLCSLLSDELGNYYYPLSGDIFNFRPHREGSNSGYSIPYSQFYATYLNEKGENVLFIRRTIVPEKLGALTYKVNGNCDKDSRFKLPLSLEEKNINLQSGDFKFYEDYENKYALYQTNRLSAMGIPSHLGSFVNRIKLVNEENLEELDWFSPDSNQDEIFMLENELLYISKKYASNPFLASGYNVRYSVVNRDIYNRDTALGVVSGEDEMEILNETPDKVSIKTKRDKSGLLVTRNTFSHDWVSRIDGRESDTLVINGLYLATVVPEGEHTVEFEYRPEWFKVLMKLTPIYALLIPAFIFFQRLFGFEFLKSKVSKIGLFRKGIQN